jgi:hypothetical protein
MKDGAPRYLSAALNTTMGFIPVNSLMAYARLAGVTKKSVLTPLLKYYCVRAHGRHPKAITGSVAGAAMGLSSAGQNQQIGGDPRGTYSFAELRTTAAYTRARLLMASAT